MHRSTSGGLLCGAALLATIARVSAAVVFALCAPVVAVPRAAVPAAQAGGQGTKPPGQVAFDRVCRVCHGAEGRGDAAPRLVPFDLEYDEVLAIVRYGRGEMPPQSADVVTDEDVAAIVDYLKSLSRP